MISYVSLRGECDSEIMLDASASILIWLTQILTMWVVEMTILTNHLPKNWVSCFETWFSFLPRWLAGRMYYSPLKPLKQLKSHLAVKGFVCGFISFRQ